MSVSLRRVQERIERSCARLGVTYPWWIPACSALACLALTVTAYAQREPLAAPVLAALLLTVVPVLVWAVRGWLLPPWVESIGTTIAVALYLTHPVSPDFAPFLCLILVGEVAATSRLWLAGAVCALQIVILGVAAGAGHLQNASLYLIGVILGLSVGIALRWQMRALNAERANTAMVRDQAMLAERQRLAREVHDVVGHSLSINLLHVTSARHTLQEHADIADAVESLTEAERVGRAAMSDLRRTVAVLRDGPAEVQPLPGIEDVPALIEQSRLAGLDVSLWRAGDCAGIGDSAGLGVYRILQESLANIAKHAPRASATVRLTSDRGGLRLSVRSSLPAGSPPRAPVDGSGLPGMAARAEQFGARLRAGVEGDSWLVDLTLPRGVSG